MTPKQRFQLRRQDLISDCEHEHPGRCHARTDASGRAWHSTPAWHVWDLKRNDYAYGTNVGEFDRARDARDFRRTIIAAVEAGELQ